MVSILQRALEASKSYGFKDEEFFAHLALAKKLPESNHLDLALEKVNDNFSPDEVISYIFECTTCSFEKCLPIITNCQVKKYRARAYCVLATHFPDKKAECLEHALRDADKNDKIYAQIALTFQLIPTANKISRCYRRTVVLLEICKENLETDPGKAASAFRSALSTKESGKEICDLYRDVAIKASLLKLKEAAFYAKGYFLSLEKMDTKVQARHCKPLFNELVSQDKDAAVVAVEEAKKMPVIATQGALIIAEKITDVLHFASMVAIIKKALGSLEKGSFKNHAAIRLATLLKMDKIPKIVDRDFVTTARWIQALFAMGKKHKAIPYIKTFPSIVKAYLASVTTASTDAYTERRDMLLKAALKLINCLPDIALELIRLALPTLANDRQYISHIEAVVGLAVKQPPFIQQRILAQLLTVFARDNSLHMQKLDAVRFFIDLAAAVKPLSGSHALQLVSQARTCKSNLDLETIAFKLESYPAFKEVQLELYTQALADDPQNTRLTLICARNSPPARQEELLNGIFDRAESEKNVLTPANLQNIISLYL